MMSSTHALSGATVGAVLGAAVPDLLAPAVVVGFVAGMLPDLDLLWTHRRTTHFPTYGVVVALESVGFAVVSGRPLALLLVVAAVSIALHPLFDVLCGGVEVRPWEATSEEAVYDHARRRWLRPRRVVRYAGAPEDLALAVGVSLPALLVTTGALRGGLVVVLVVSALFVAVRRRLVGVSARLVADDSHGR